MDDKQQNFLILTSVDFGIDTRNIKFPLITPQESPTTCNRMHVLNWVSKLGIPSKQGRKISDICLKQGQGMRGRAATPHPGIFRVPPGGQTETETRQGEYIFFIVVIARLYPSLFYMPFWSALILNGLKCNTTPRGLGGLSYSICVHKSLIFDRFLES